MVLQNDLELSMLSWISFLLKLVFSAFILLFTRFLVFTPLLDGLYSLQQTSLFVLLAFLRTPSRSCIGRFVSLVKGCLHDLASPACNEAWDRFDELKIKNLIQYKKTAHQPEQIRQILRSYVNDASA
jgi:hypothetical protein